MDEQITLFDLTMPIFEIHKPIRLIELFSGVGAQAMALRNIGADFEHYRSVEIDKYAVQSYNAIHGTDFEPTDITTVNGEDLGIVDKDKYAYILTYSFPCQSISQAGTQQGFAENSGTRSSLLWEVRRILDELDDMPDVLLMENVPAIHSEKFMPDFRKWLAYLDGKGYTSFWQDMNAKDYGVAQNRLRTFVVSLYWKYNYHFPKPIELCKNFADYLEDGTVDDRYYMHGDRPQKLIDEMIADGRIIRGGWRQTVDGTTNNPKCTNIANCVKAKYRGLSTRQSEENCVIERQGREI